MLRGRGRRAPFGAVAAAFRQNLPRYVQVCIVLYGLCRRRLRFIASEESVVAPPA